MINKKLTKSILATAGEEMVPSFLKWAEKANKNKSSQKREDRQIIVIQFSGGNDGLNTVVPFQNDLYYQARPRLHISANKVLKATDELGFHPALSTLQKLYDQGELAIINGVGYPNHTLSHFRSMDIWHTGSSAQEYWETGWIGRYLDQQSQAHQQRFVAIEADDTLSLALKGKIYKGLAVKDPKNFYKNTQNPLYQKAIQNFTKNYTQIPNPNNTSNPKNHPNQTNHSHNHSAQYLYKTLIDTVSSADYIYEKVQLQNTTDQGNYPNTEIGRQLSKIAQMIVSGVESQVYYASMIGFDTHVKQALKHQNILANYSDALAVFIKELKKHGAFKNTLIVTFSEFGRRVQQNASAGTDHGSANQLFVIGKKLKQAGFYNKMPSLSDLDREGNLKFSVDFRSIYATLLNKWLLADDVAILKGDFGKLSFL